WHLAALPLSSTKHHSLMSLLTTVIATVLASGPGSIANVNDPLSHGTVGDSVLSLDEAIRVANGSLSLASLSAAEQARILGTGAVQTIVVDAATTPMITIESPLSDVIGPGMMVGRLTIEGHADNGVKPRSEEHTSELQSRENLVCRL